MEETSENDNNPFGELVNFIGVRYATSSNTPDFYFVYLYSVYLDFPDDESTPRDTPLTTEDKRIIFCTRPELASALYQRGWHELTRWGECPSVPTASIDVVELLDQLKEPRGKPFDIDMFHFLAILIDCMKAIDVEYPEGYWDMLWRLTAHRIAHKQLDTFFEENDITRNQMLDVVNWVLEAIATNSVCISE